VKEAVVNLQYRNIPRCNGAGNISVLGIGMGGMYGLPDETIEHIVRRAVVNGINIFDLCAGGINVFRPFGRAIRGERDKLKLIMHFGAGFDEFGQYEWIRDFDEIRRLFRWQLKELRTDYADIGVLHCVDDDGDFESLRDDGILDYMKELKVKGVLRGLGFSTHTPKVADRLLELGIFDVMMLRINPVEDWDTLDERARLMRRCRDMGVGAIAMRVFQGGRLLDESTSPFGMALTEPQCLQYALDRTAVISALAGVQSLEQLDALLGYERAAAEERDYSFVCRFKRVEESLAEKPKRPNNVVDIFSNKKNIAK